MRVQKLTILEKVLFVRVK